MTDDADRIAHEIAGVANWATTQRDYNMRIVQMVAQALREYADAKLEEAARISVEHSHRDMAGNDVHYEECACEDRIAEDIRKLKHDK